MSLATAVVIGLLGLCYLQTTVLTILLLRKYHFSSEHQRNERTKPKRHKK
jgi:hypothetical protein